MSCERTNNLGADDHCKCTFKDCANWGKCCSCVQFHRSHGELPGCFFNAEAEKAGNRSVDFFIQNIGMPVKENH